MCYYKKINKYNNISYYSVCYYVSKVNPKKWAYIKIKGHISSTQQFLFFFYVPNTRRNVLEGARS